MAQCKNTALLLHRRLLQDIAEMQRDPYPNIILCPQDSLRKACLLLTPNGNASIHLTLAFGTDYPLVPPQVTVQSQIDHPNVFGEYICASILNTAEGYTPAYTLRSIAIQLLSFFSSERIEQVGGGYSIKLAGWGNRDHGPEYGMESRYMCLECGFGGEKTVYKDIVRVGGKLIPDPFAQQRPDVAASTGSDSAESVLATGTQDRMEVDSREQRKPPRRLIDRILALPDELLLLVFGELDTKDLFAAAKVDSKIGDFMKAYDTIRMRELQCFCFKKSFMQTKLGVGVHISGRGGKQGHLESEFDLLSQTAFEKFGVRRSIQGLPFEHWLPLPLSPRHWGSVSADVHASLARLAKAASIPPNSACGNIEVIYNFMNTIVVKLSREAEQSWRPDIKSTLMHASEKAVESYFSIYHLLLCLATSQRQIVSDANRRLHSFLRGGNRSKRSCPNLGHLLVAALVSDQGLTQELTRAIINEAIVRNVVWMLDPQGAGLAELSYLEPASYLSEYRLQRTFDASKTSYRLLMFLALFSRTARPSASNSEKHPPLSALRDQLFDTHGAPPKGTAERMAAEIRHIRTVNSWPVFFKVMGISDMPGKQNFCAFLKGTIAESVKMGYSTQPISQGEAARARRWRCGRFASRALRWRRGLAESEKVPGKRGLSFFPRKGGSKMGRGKRR